MNLLHTYSLHHFYKNSLKDLNLFLDELDSDIELDVAQFIKSTKGHAQLVDKAGNIYNRHKTNSSQTVIYWRCTQHKKSTCFGRVQTQGFFITKYVNKHSHPPPEEQFQSPVWDFAKQLFSNFTFIWINFYLTYKTSLQIVHIAFFFLLLSIQFWICLQILNLKLQNLPQANMAILNWWIQRDLYTEGIKAVPRTIKLFGFVLKETRLNVKLEQLLPMLLNPKGCRSYLRGIITMPLNMNTLGSKLCIQSFARF